MEATTTLSRHTEGLWVAIVLVAIACLFFPPVKEFIAKLVFNKTLLAMAWGALGGAGVGSLLGGAISAFTGGSFWKGFKEGAFWGAVGGALFGGMQFAITAGKAALSLGQLLGISGLSGVGTSLFSDFGDIFIKGEDISFGQVIFNAIRAGGLAVLFAGVFYGISKALGPALKKLSTVFKKGVGGATNPSSQIKGNSYDINQLKKTQPYTYPENVESIKQSILQNGPDAVPPIEIRVHNGKVLVVDGHHRLEAFQQLGYDRVPIKYIHSSQLGKTLPDGTYYRSLQELLDGLISN